MYEKIIVDADLCIKLGCSEKYRFLFEVLPLISEKIYMHEHAFSEVLIPESAQKQLKELVDKEIVSVVSEKNLSKNEKIIFRMAYKMLSEVMIDPSRPNKNKGETCSLAYAKATGIPIFATDEKTLQPIIDKLLNTGIDDIHCLRIIDIIELCRNGQIALSRKYAKALWRIASGRKDANDLFDSKIWPVME